MYDQQPLEEITPVYRVSHDLQTAYKSYFAISNVRDSVTNRPPEQRKNTERAILPTRWDQTVLATGIESKCVEISNRNRLDTALSAAVG